MKLDPRVTVVPLSVELCQWRQEFRASWRFTEAREYVWERLNIGVDDMIHPYGWDENPAWVHAAHNVEASAGISYCCHTCNVLGVDY